MENILLKTDIFKPKSKKDIIKSLKYLSKREKDEKLIEASKDGQLSIVKLLIEAKTDINAKNIYESTALMHASAHNYLDIVKLLIEAGADVNIRNKYGETALTLAFNYKHLDLSNLLKNMELNNKTLKNNF